MLYRFRETQAIESGMGDRQKGERRPRMASSVTNLRDCERWRGDIMRDISRKVSKIQDSKYLASPPARRAVRRGERGQPGVSLPPPSLRIRGKQPPCEARPTGLEREVEEEVMSKGKGKD